MVYKLFSSKEDGHVDHVLVVGGDSSVGEAFRQVGLGLAQAGLVEVNQNPTGIMYVAQCSSISIKIRRLAWSMSMTLQLEFLMSVPMEKSMRRSVL